jgi:hypothetical protein
MTKVSVALLALLVLPYHVFSLIHQLSTKRLLFLYRVRNLEVEKDRVQ